MDTTPTWKFLPTVEAILAETGLLKVAKSKTTSIAVEIPFA